MGRPERVQAFGHRARSRRTGREQARERAAAKGTGTEVISRGKGARARASNGFAATRSSEYLPDQNIEGGVHPVLWSRRDRSGSRRARRAQRARRCTVFCHYEGNGGTAPVFYPHVVADEGYETKGEDDCARSRPARGK